MELGETYIVVPGKDSVVPVVFVPVIAYEELIHGRWNRTVTKIMNANACVRCHIICHKGANSRSVRCCGCCYGCTVS